MASLIPGYNYDIFISYRQKDNKHDGWVTEFVNNLKGELESTFKEEVSVYFDINPHDGLLETHDVDESLKQKLKCLVFIPIISRTYCDPKSFAWENEFKAFIEQASKDQYGLKVKLPGGNVANRVLPVQIHDLDAEDRKMVEDELGGHLRGIEFIYKEPGVNKPLTGNDDEKKNLNNTRYRIQVNKTANAIKEIITAIKQSGQKPDIIPEKPSVKKPSGSKGRITKTIAASVIAMLLIAAGLIFIPKLFKSSAKLEKSIAVLPFKNDSPDQERMYFINATMEAILDNLCKIKDLRVPGRTSVEQYRDNLKPIPTIAKELDVNYILEGSGHRDGNNVRLYVQLLDARKDKHLWSKTYDADIEYIFSMQSEIAQLVAAEIEAIITPEEKQRIEKIPTTSLTALDFYQTGREEYWKYQTDPHNLTALNKAEDLYKKALQYDPEFAKAYVGLAEVYWNKNYVAQYLSENFMDSALVLANTALSYDTDLAEAYVLRGYYYGANGYIEQALKEYDKALDINPGTWQAYFGKAQIYLHTDLLNAIKSMHEVLSINRGRELPYLLQGMGEFYCHAGFPEIARKYFQETLILTNDSVGYYMGLGAGNLHSDAIKNFRNAYMLDSTNLEVLFNLGCYYSYVGQYKESLVFIEKWLEQLDQTLVARYRDNGMHRVGYAYWKNNRFDEANYYFDLQIKYNNGQIKSNLFDAQLYYSYYDRAGVYAFRGEREKAYEDLRVFNQRPIEHKWMVNLIKADPLFDSIRDEPEFQQIVRDVEARYKAEHERVRKWLEERGEL